MSYKKRELERKFLHMSSAFKAVMVVGARQVEKSTMLKHLAKDQSRTYVTIAKNIPKTILSQCLKTFGAEGYPMCRIKTKSRYGSVSTRIRIKLSR